MTRHRTPEQPSAGAGPDTRPGADAIASSSHADHGPARAGAATPAPVPDDQADAQAQDAPTPSDPGSALERAYRLRTPQDNRALYRDWADSYDRDFAQAMDYRVPENTARVLADVLDGDFPVLDIGAGTGLVGRWLARLGISPVDGLDISPEMLAVAARSGVYAGLLAADLTRKLPIADERYGALVSAGTFTLGHVGPEALEELLRIGRKGAVYVLTVNPDHYRDAGFADAFARLGPRITGFSIRRIAGYGPGATGPHRDDVFNACIFRKA